MSDEPPPMEGWNVSSRLVFAAMVAILIALTIGLTWTEHRYRATIEPTTHPRVHRFPTPTLDGFDDTSRPASEQLPGPSAPLNDAALAAAASNSALLQDAPK